MQFTYEREGNNCWYTVKLTFTKEVILINQQWLGSFIHEYSEVIKPEELLEILSSRNLLISNFSGLEDYLKENYPEVLFKESKDIDYKKLLENLVRLIESDIDSINHYSNSELGKAEEFKAACLALDSDWYLGKHLE